MTKEAIIVVDMQNGFMVDNNGNLIPEMANIASGISKLLEAVTFEHRIFTTFRNVGNGGFFAEQMGWYKCQLAPETEIIDALAEYQTVHVRKTTYSAFITPILSSYLKRHNIDEVYVCGADTNVCVTSMLIDLADRNIKSVVIEDLCASHSGEKFHKAGVLSFPKIVGERNIVSSKSLF